MSQNLSSAAVVIGALRAHLETGHNLNFHPTDFSNLDKNKIICPVHVITEPYLPFITISTHRLLALKIKIKKLN